jgi:hypothetical protein
MGTRLLPGSKKGIKKSMLVMSTDKHYSSALRLVVGVV